MECHTKCALVIVFIAVNKTYMIFGEETHEYFIINCDQYYKGKGCNSR